MKKIVLTLIVILVFTASKTNAQEILVSNITEYNNTIKTAKAGAIIVLKNGVWKDIKLNAYGKGEEGNPILIKAETAGEVIIQEILL